MATPEGYTEVTEPVMLDSTAQQMLVAMKEQNTLLSVLAGTGLGSMDDVEVIRRVVQAGQGSKVYNVGDQLISDWIDTTTGKAYEAPANIVHFSDVELQDGETVPGMFMEWQYATLYGVQFSQYQAFYYAEEELPAGTYYITVGDNWGTYCKKDAVYHFTLTKPVPAGGQLAGFYGMPDKAPDQWRVYSYTGPTSATPIETVTPAAGASGISLGTFTNKGDGTLNSIQRLAYGSNRWSTSAIRQWLNSDKGVGEWWTPQGNFDRVPDQLNSKPGFLSGFDKDLLKCIQPVKVVTALNTLTDASGDVQTETTYDRIFLASLEQIYSTPQLAETEGNPWIYWKRALGLTKPSNYHPNVYEAYKTYALENHTSAQLVRLRSANRGYACYAWYRLAGGSVNYYGAIHATRCTPAWVIC